LHDFNREFDEPAPAPAVLEPRVRSFIVDGTKTYLLGGAGPDGVAQVTLIPTIWADRPIAHLDELYVRPERRGEGIGRALMEAVIALARQRDAAGLEVVTGEDDLAARALYESLGFANQIEGPDNARSLFYEREL
jgi:ribosomal protein S18 acetylase RimI-like enzyme